MDGWGERAEVGYLCRVIVMVTMCQLVMAPRHTPPALVTDVDMLESLLTVVLHSATLFASLFTFFVLPVTSFALLPFLRLLFYLLS